MTTVKDSIPSSFSELVPHETANIVALVVAALIIVAVVIEKVTRRRREERREREYLRGLAFRQAKDHEHDPR